ncbi:hypothetical protein [Streptomyces sp. NPDC096193]|uniref:hypothetical protein n=1 Tax=Streptomyces sp. NPDC096193 TaxID=3155821 RepID=UPI00332C1679
MVARSVAGRLLHLPLGRAVDAVADQGVRAAAPARVARVRRQEIAYTGVALPHIAVTVLVGRRAPLGDVRDESVGAGQGGPVEDRPPYRARTRAAAR